MKQIISGFFLPLCLICIPKITVAAEFKSSPPLAQNLSSQTRETFYTAASRLVQQQINLTARIETALSHPDANRMRAVGGQLAVHTKVVESFLQRQHPNPQALCAKNSLTSTFTSFDHLNESLKSIYCSLYASNRELLKLTPVLDRLLSRRGELATVRSLPLVSGERQSHPVLAISEVQRPNLHYRATPFAIREPDLDPTAPIFFGRTAKTALADYTPPMQPAIAPPAFALVTLQTARQLLKPAQTAFPSGIEFPDPQKNALALARYTYDLDPQEVQTHAKFLLIPNTGIFRALPSDKYLRRPNTIENRLDKSISTRYPFPVISPKQEGFKHSLPLQIVGENFEIIPKGIDYSFMVDVGDIPLEDLDANLENISAQRRDFLLNYQPPQKLSTLQTERQRVLTGKDQLSWDQQVVFNRAPAKLHHTYLVRSLDFQLPEVIRYNQPISREQRRHIDKLLEMQASDIILAFRPVRRRSDGSYTILWRVLNQFSEPKIADLEDYLQYSE